MELQPSKCSSNVQVKMRFYSLTILTWTSSCCCPEFWFRVIIDWFHHDIGRHIHDRVCRPVAFARGQCCHTHPNDRLLQRRYVDKETVLVVIPIQTTGFYNQNAVKRVHGGSCYTHPNDRLLQRKSEEFVLEVVVIPIQTTGFYNKLRFEVLNVTVVIPIQTTGFYNNFLRKWATIIVVIPIQTTGFYNPVTDNWLK